MNIIDCPDRESVRRQLQSVGRGDCLRIAGLASLADDARGLVSAALALQAAGIELISLAEGIDTAAQGGQFFAVCRAMNELEHSARREKQRGGIERAREEGKYRGRKPIEINEELFDGVLALWESGEITAREAMDRLALKPNTFYRRIKERKEHKMKDYKKVEKEIKSEIKEAAKKSRQELDDLRAQVRSEAREIRKAAEEKLDAHDVEKEIRRERIHAEIERHDELRQIKKDVVEETKELKKLLETEEK